MQNASPEKDHEESVFSDIMVIQYFAEIILTSEDYRRQVGVKLSEVSPPAVVVILLSG